MVWTSVLPYYATEFILPYKKIDEIDLEENSVEITGPYNPAEPLSQLRE